MSQCLSYNELPPHSHTFMALLTIFYYFCSGQLPRMASVLETPSRIVRLDLSLNELTALEHSSLQPLYNLRELNASLNRITKYV